MRLVTTRFNCDRCGEQETFHDVRTVLPAHWQEVVVGDPPAGAAGKYVRRRSTICRSCRIALVNWFNRMPA